MPDLPPLIGLVQADISDFLAKMEIVQQRISSLGDMPNIVVTASTSDADSKIATTQAASDALGDSDPTITPQVDIGPALAKIAALNLAWDANLARWRTTSGQFANNSQIAQMAAGLSADQRSSLPADALAALTAAGGGGKGGGIGGILSALGWGGGLFGMASAGSLASFAGFDALHLLTTGAGLAGFAGAGLAGGGLLGLGALGTGAVGMGTDLAGIGQAAGDIKNVTTAMSALTTAQQTYGTASQQAATAQAQLNATLAGFSPVARQAVQQAATIAENFKTMFDQVTGQAEKMGAQIISEAILVGQKFLPTIGKFATENTATIQRDLQPLFAWLGSSSGGLGIFTQLEQTFQKQLPAGLSILTNGIELFANAVNDASKFTGPFIKEIAGFLDKVNTPSGLASMDSMIGKLIGDFRVWEQFIKAVIEDVDALFKNDAGTAKAIVNTITDMLNKLHDWLTSTSGAAQVHSIFEIHKQEIITLLNLLPGLFSAFWNIYIKIAPPLVEIVVLLAHAIEGVVNFVKALGPVGTILGWAAAIAIVSSKLIGLYEAIKGLAIVQAVASGIGAVGVASEGAVGGVAALTGAIWPLAAALTAAALAYKTFGTYKSLFDSTALGTSSVSDAPNIDVFAKQVAADVKSGYTGGYPSMAAMLSAMNQDIRTGQLADPTQSNGVANESWSFNAKGQLVNAKGQPVSPSSPSSPSGGIPTTIAGIDAWIASMAKSLTGGGGTVPLTAAGTPIGGAAGGLPAAVTAYVQALARDTAALQAHATIVAADATKVTDAAAQFATITGAKSTLATDAATAQVNAINNAATIATDNSNAQVAAIQDASQITTDTIAEQGLTGQALAAAQAQVALDVQKQTDDAKVAADQLALDQQKAIDQAKVAAATAHADQVALHQDQLVNRAQSRLDTGTITSDAKVNAAMIANTIAQAGTNTALQAKTAAALSEAQAQQTSTLASLNAAYTGAQATQTRQNAIASATLAAITNAANVTEALLAAQLAGDQGAAAVAEAKLAAIVQQLNAAVAAQAATTAAVTAAATPTTAATTPIQITVVSQIDGQTVALVTTPLIRQEILRSTGRQTQNVFGGSAGRLVPS